MIGRNSSMDAKLVVVGGEIKAGEYHLTLPTIIGRSRSADLTVGNPLVSRQHCEIYEADGQLMVRDLGSLNGTFIGEKRITQEAALEPGDLLTVGAVTFRAVYGNVEELEELPGLAELPGEDSAGTPGATSKPQEIEQTLQAGGLADLERLRDSQEPAPPAEVAGEPPLPDDDFDLEWLEEDGDPPSARSGGEAKAQASPAVGDVQEVEEIEQLEEVVEDFELELAEPETTPITRGKTADKRKQPDGTETVRAKDSASEEETLQFAPPADKPAAKADDDDLNEFFKNLE